MTTKKLPAIENYCRLFIHEIRNPLTTILTANQVMEQNLLADDKNQQYDLKKLMKLITKNILRIDELLRKALDAPTDDSHRFGLCNVAEIIDRVLQQAEDRIVLHKMQVKKKYETKRYISGHEEKMLLVFGNIITNALEAITGTEGKLWISVEGDDGTVTVTFRDNGCGMSPEVARRLFRTHVTSKSRGLGVGLLLVKEILDAHQAKVAVESSPGKGTTISITFKEAAYFKGYEHVREKAVGIEP